MLKRLGLIVALLVLIGLSEATLYKVGDNQGWKWGVNYTEWSASETFYVGDTIGMDETYLLLFFLNISDCRYIICAVVFNYGRGSENVLQVTHKAFRDCNSDNPIRAFHTGKDVFVLENRSHLFFICGLPGHCESGQKVDIRVFDYPESPAPAPESERWPSPSPSPALPATPPSSSPTSPPTPPSSYSPSPSPAPGVAPSSATRRGWGVQLALAAFVVVLSVAA